MSRLKTRWLWIVVAIEVAAIAGLLIWATTRQTDVPPADTPTTQQDSSPTYKTPKIELSQVAGGLAEPVAIVATPVVADRRLFVVEQSGTIRIITAEKSLDMTPFLDIKGKVKAGGEMGLLGMAFHPKVAENNFFYVNYIDKSQNTIIARYSISTVNGRADPTSEKVLLKVKQPYTNHNGGNLTFGPDGYLYIGMGDGGSAGDPENRAQDKNDLLGKMLRINVDGGDPYAIPADNPFASSGGKPEIWALGLRNPWRFSFDRQTGDLYIADVGQGDWEEINYQEAVNKGGGANYGWRCFEGTHEFDTTGCQDANTYVKPILQYDHGDSRCSVTGGHVYRGSKYPALAGQYFYGDYCSGQIFYAKQSNAAWTPILGVATSFNISTFGEDSTGELYVADRTGGNVYQITDTAN